VRQHAIDKPAVNGVSKAGVRLERFFLGFLPQAPVNAGSGCGQAFSGPLQGVVAVWPVGTKATACGVLVPHTSAISKPPSKAISDSISGVETRLCAREAQRLSLSTSQPALSSAAAGLATTVPAGSIGRCCDRREILEFADRVPGSAGIASVHHQSEPDVRIAAIHVLDVVGFVPAERRR
jgi:hypothetical protein